MTESKHTPGPWKVETWHNEGEIAPRYSIVNGEGAVVISGMWYDCPQDWADAELMAAAPELLEALESLLNEIDARGYHNDFTKQRTIIAKAKDEQLIKGQ